jgi:peptide/nickel transport system substrate-binding protein
VSGSYRWLRPLLLLTALLLAACRQSATPDTLIFGIASAPGSLNPILATDASAERITGLLYAPLVELDAQGRPTPGQVHWQQLAAQHYRLQWVEHPATFVDGRTPTMADVQATLRAAIDQPASPHASTLAHVQRLQPSADGASLDVYLSRPDPRFAEKLHLGLIPAQRSIHSLNWQPLGSGRFRLISHDAQDNLLLERRRDGLKVRFDVAPDPTMRALKLIRGELNLLQNDLPYELYPRLQREPGVELHSASGSTFSYLGFNLDDRILADRRVREAIAHAVDRQAIVHYLFQDHAELSDSLLRPEHWAANPNLPTYTYDPDRARALLQQAGYSPSHPLVLSYKTSTDPFRLRIAAALQAQLARVGIQLNIQSYEWGTFFGDIKAGRFQLYSLSWVGIRSPDIFRYAFHSGSVPPHGANRGHYRSPQVDRWIERAEQLPDTAAARLFRQVQAQLQQDLVYLPLWHEQNLLLSRGVDHARPLPNGAYDFLDKVSLRHGP